MRDAASKADDVREERKAEEAEWCQHGFSHRRCEACLRAEVERLEAENDAILWRGKLVWWTFEGYAAATERALSGNAKIINGQREALAQAQAERDEARRLLEEQALITADMAVAEAEVRHLRAGLETIDGLCERHEGAEWQSLATLIRNVARAALEGNTHSGDKEAPPA